MAFSLEGLAQRTCLGAILAGSALFLNGCATNNPAANALGNWFGNMLIAEAGAPKQTVTVNTQPVYSQTFVTADRWEDTNGDKKIVISELRNVKNVFQAGQSIEICYEDNGPVRSPYQLHVFNAQGVLVHQYTIHSMGPGFGVRISRVLPGTFTLNALGNGQYLAQQRITILPTTP